MNYKQYTMHNSSQECVKRFNHNNTLNANLGLIFTHLCDNLRIIFKFNCAAHFFVNENLPQIDFLFTNEINLIDPKNEPANSKYKRINFDKSERCSYDLFKELQGHSADKDVQDFHQIEVNDLNIMLKLLEFPLENCKHTIQKNIIIPFKLSFLNLGFFLLWDKIEDSSQIVEDGELAAWIASQYYFLSGFLIGEYSIINKMTYLPSLYTARWNKIAVLFADIMNFDLLFEKIGAKHGEEGNTNILRKVLNKYCEEMSIVVQESGLGRITNFFGTQIMAVYGEHEDEPTEAVGNAIYSARKMIEKFDELKSNFLQDTYGKDYQTEYNEDINLYLRIGIDFGNVLFDHLGNDYHREYTAFGNHVEFAKFLNRESLKTVRENFKDISILISQTANRCVLPFLLPEDKVKLNVYDSEKGRNYDIFSVKNFQEKYFLECRNNKSWVEAWNNQDYSKP